MKTCICQCRLGYDAVRHIPVFQWLETKESVVKVGQLCLSSSYAPWNTCFWGVSSMGGVRENGRCRGVQGHLLSTDCAAASTVASSLHSDHTGTASWHAPPTDRASSGSHRASTLLRKERNLMITKGVSIMSFGYKSLEVLPVTWNHTGLFHPWNHCKIHLVKPV